MPRRRTVPPRRVILIGVEGKSDRAFAQFLQRCCDGQGQHLHLNVKAANGGDSVAVVNETVRHFKRQLDRRDINARLVLLDRDRYDQDVHAGRAPQAVASKWKLKIVFQTPNLEGLLLRLHPGHERRKIVPVASMAELRKVWPEYSKSSLTADQLTRRFTVSDLQRVARYDQELRSLLDVLGL